MSTTRDPQLATAIEHWAPRFVANGAKAEAGGGEPPGRPDPPDPPLFPHTE